MPLITDAQVKTALGISSYPSAAVEGIAQMMRPIAIRFVRDFVGYYINQRTVTEWHPGKGRDETGDLLIEGFEMRGNRAMAYGPTTRQNRVLTVRDLPLRAITSVHENLAASDDTGTPTFPASSLLTPGSDYYGDFQEPGLSETGFIYRRGGSWNSTPRTIQVIYTGGYTDAELDLATGDYPEYAVAALQTAVKLFNEHMAQRGYAAGDKSVGPVTAESLLDWSVSYAVNAAEQNMGFQRGLPLSAAQLLEDKVRMTKYLET